MKKYYFAAFFFLSMIFSYGQHRVAHKINDMVAKQTEFKRFTPLVTDTAVGSPDAVKDATYATINSTIATKIAAAKYNALEVDIPYRNGMITVQLYRADILAEGFHVDTDKEKNAIYKKGAYYRGIIKGNEESIASFNFFEGEMNGIISSPELQNLVIGKLNTPGNATRYVIYSDANLSIPNTFSCSTEDPDVTKFDKRGTNNTSATESVRCVTMYFEMDNDLYVANGSSMGQTANWMTSVFNNVQTLFYNDGITTALKSIFIWTIPDPYSGTSSSDYLNQFNAMQPSFDGDLGQLVGIDPGGLGGVAVNIAGICSDFNFSYSDVDFDYQSVPLFSWTVQVITHELGHLMGSPHTHGCYWNGNNTSIDGCGTAAGYVEGNCAQGPIPSAAVKGTIMSYCHLINGVGINFANGFGPQPATRILNHVESSSCLSTDCINTCINTVVDFKVNATLNSAVITWTDTSSAGPWQVAVTTATGNFTTWQTVTLPSYNAMGLTANTYYKFGIRPLCVAGVTPETEELTFATDANFCAGVNFYDTGGTSGNYTNDQYLIRTLKPGTAGAKIRVVFSSLNIEDGYDYLLVYNGPDTDAPLLGVYTGTTPPGPFQSTAADGSLTFIFISDSYLTASGWRATVSCVTTLGTATNEFTNLAYYPNPTTGLVTIEAGEPFSDVTVYNVAGQLLMHKKVNTDRDVTDISSYAAGVYFFKVTDGVKEANFRIIKQD
jgi:hypothetical protein